jgi:hypothetical protein
LIEGQTLVIIPQNLISIYFSSSTFHYVLLNPTSLHLDQHNFSHVLFMMCFYFIFLLLTNFLSSKENFKCHILDKQPQIKSSENKFLSSLYILCISSVTSLNWNCTIDWDFPKRQILYLSSFWGSGTGV